MQAQSITRVAGRQDVCIFCAFRYVFETPASRIPPGRQVRSFVTTQPKLKSNQNLNDRSLPLGGGWGAIGDQLGATDFQQPPAWSQSSPSTSKPAAIPSKPKQEGSKEKPSDRNRASTTAHLRDIIPPKVTKRPLRIRRINFNAESESPKDEQGQHASQAFRKQFGMSNDPALKRVTRNNAVSKRAPIKGTVGGLEELINSANRSSRVIESSQKNDGSRRRKTDDFEARAESSSDPSLSTLHWKPGEDFIFNIKPVEETAEDDLQGIDERSMRRSSRFEDDVVDIASQPSRPKRGNWRARGFDDFDPEVEDDEFFEGQRNRKKKGKKGKKAERAEKEGDVDELPQLAVPDFIEVESLAKLLRVRIDDFIERLEDMGFESPNHDHILDSETAGLIVSEFGFIPVLASSTAEDLVARPPPEDKSTLPSRPPIITIMGHVDHGKTTILDYLRKSSVAASEHGGITQHIGAFSVRLPGVDRLMTFLDTPGHAAFLEMRRRGANVTDIVVLVVAADDGVKPQTIEAIKHALKANVQIIVAINKIDKHDANPEKVKHELAGHGIEVEDLGGNIQAIPVSGKTGKGMQDLEEAILALSEAEDYRAEIDGQAEGWVIEANVTQAGRLATVLVRRGTMRPGDYIVAGTTWAKIRSLRNDAGQLLDEAPPGTPVQVDGWRDQPLAGFEVLQAESEQQAKDVVEMRLEREEMARMTGDASAINAARKEEAEERARVLAWEKEQEWARLRYSRRPKDNEGWVEPKEQDTVKKLNLVVKADVTGSVEAVVNALSSLGNHEVATNIIRSGVGPVNLSDIQHASATGDNGYVVSFNQSIDAEMYRLAENAGAQILDYNIIYRLTDAVQEKLSDLLPPLITQRVHGEAEIGQVFEVTIKKDVVKIAGCRVTNGSISRDRRIRVSRNNQIIFDGKLSSLKNVKKDVTEMRKGSECGMGFEGWQDFEAGDFIQSYEEIREKRKL